MWPGLTNPVLSPKLAVVNKDWTFNVLVKPVYYRILHVDKLRQIFFSVYSINTSNLLFLYTTDGEKHMVGEKHQEEMKQQGILIREHFICILLWMLIFW